MRELEEALRKREEVGREIRDALVGLGGSPEELEVLEEARRALDG